MSSGLRVNSAVFITLLALAYLNCTAAAASVQVYVAYADTQNVNCPNPNPPAFMPNPWLGSPRVTFLGHRGPGPWNTGAILIFNPGSAAVTIQSATVTIGINPSYKLWNRSLPKTIPPGGELIWLATPKLLRKIGK